MTKQIFKIFLLFLTITVTTSCKDKAEEATTTVEEEVAVSEATATKYNVVVEESTIEWTGFKPTGKHFGTLSIAKGAFKATDGNIESGSFVLDMNTITVTDLEPGDGKEDLEAHLKGTVEGKEDHFFDVAKYPTASFDITSMDTVDGKTMLSGNLTIKGNTNNISFPVSVESNDDSIKLTSETFSINRVKWNINYGSKSIFDNLGDQFINDDMELKITVKAKKA